MKRFSILVLVLVLLTATLASCGLLADQCEHTYSDKWEVDDNDHWHKATCEHTDLISSKGGHVDENNDGACDMCGHGEVHMHTYTDAWTSDANGHWHLATCDGHTTVKGDVYAHKNADNNADCDLCGYVLQWTLAVDADEAVDVADEVYASKDTGKVTFEAKVSDEFILHVTGATQKGEAVIADGVATYTYEVADVAADGEVAIAAERVTFASKLLEKTATVALESFWGGVRGTIAESFELPAGTYMLAGEGEDVVVSFMDSDYMNMSVFTLEKAKTVEVTVSVVDETGSLTEADCTYALYSIPTTEINMTALEGAGYKLPVGTTMTLKFVAPEAGLYFLSSLDEFVLWNGDLALCIAYAEDAEDVISVSVGYNGDTANATYDFDWKVEKLVADVDAVVGENEIALNYRDFTVVELTATETAAYTIDLSALSAGTAVYVLGEDWWGNIGLVELENNSMMLNEGDKVTLYLVNTSELDFAEGDTITEAIVVEKKTLVTAVADIEVTETNTYMFSSYWVDDNYEDAPQLFSFTAPAAGIYTIYAPEGFGLWSKDSYDAWGDAEIDPYNGTTSASFELAENEVLEFYVMALEAGTYQLQYTYTEAEVGGDDDQGGEPSSTVFVLGENTGVASMGQVMSGAEYTFTPTVSGTYTVTTGNNVSYIMIGNSPIASTVELTADEPVIFRVFVNAAGEFTVTITAPAA